MLPLRILNTLKNLKLDDLMIPVLSPLCHVKHHSVCMKGTFLLNKYAGNLQFNTHTFLRFYGFLSQ